MEKKKHGTKKKIISFLLIRKDRMKLTLFFYLCLVTAYVVYSTIRVEQLRIDRDKCIIETNVLK